MHGEYGLNMVNLITEKIITTPTISPTQMTAKPVAPVQLEPVITPENEQKNKKKLALPLSLIAGGGILLYFGLRKPKPETLYDNFVRGQINEMQGRVRIFTAFVKSTLDAKFEKAPSLIENFKTKRFVEPTADLGPLRVLKDPKKLLNAQDIAFDAIADVDKAQHKMGPPDFYVFSGEIGKMQKSADYDIQREQRIVKLELSDYVKIRRLKNEKYTDYVDIFVKDIVSIVNQKLDARIPDPYNKSGFWLGIEFCGYAKPMEE
jgi:hypothetical protein